MPPVLSISTVGFVVDGVGAATGVALLLWGGGTAPVASRAVLRAGPASVLVEGRF